MFTHSPDNSGSVGDEMVIIRLHLGGGKDDAERIPSDPGTGSRLWKERLEITEV